MTIAEIKTALGNLKSLLEATIAEYEAVNLKLNKINQAIHELEGAEAEKENKIDLSILD